MASYYSSGAASATTTSVPSVVLKNQPVTVAVIERAAVTWTENATAWKPAVAVWAGADYFAPYGFAMNVSGGFADIYVAGILDGFPSFGAFVGDDVYVDPNIPGALTFLPSPFTDTYVVMGKSISTTAIKIQPYNAADYITSKGGLLTNAGANNGTGDQVLAVGTNGTVLIANSGAPLGIQWAAPIVATTPFAFTATTRTLTAAIASDSVTGFLSAADHTTYTGYGVLKAPLTSPAFTGDVNATNGNVLVSAIGKGLSVKTGTNAKIGTAVLVAGTKTITNTAVTANSLIFLTSQINGGTPGFLRITAKTVGTSFVITSSSATDTSTVAWVIVESIP